MKSGLSQMKLRGGLEQGSHMSCLVVFLRWKPGLWLEANLRVQRALQQGWGWLLPPRPQRPSGDVKGGSLHWVPFSRKPRQAPASVSPLQKSLSSPLFQTSFCVSPQQKARVWFFF